MNVSYFLRKFRSVLWKKKKKRICKEKSDFFLFISFFSFFVYKRKNKIFVKKCRDSFFSPIPHGGWDLGPAGPIQWICREWAKRLGLSGRTIVSHGVPDDCTEVNELIQEDLLLGMAWVDLVLGLGPSPHFGLLLPPFILAFSPLSNVHV